ncbi:tRNA-(ms[2]io[6]A)-hydroxylase [soil metagenome]
MLGLKVATDPRWVERAKSDLDAVLVDHAHCEMKAASNALALAGRHPDRTVLVRRLVAIAQEELVHFDRVLGILEARGLELGVPAPDRYAAELRQIATAAPRLEATSNGEKRVHPLVDRLLVGALIEARSCERFKLLMDVLPRDSDLYAFYTELFAAEARHHREFQDLAILAADGDAELVRVRLERLSDAEGALVHRLAQTELRPEIHG